MKAVPSPAIEQSAAFPTRAIPAAATPAAGQLAADAALHQLKEVEQSSPQTSQLRQLQALADGEIPQLAAMEEEETLQGAGMEEDEALQGAGMEEEEPLQGAGMEEEEPLQGAGLEEEEPVQGKFAAAGDALQREEMPAPNNTGMPDNLKSGIESLSGMDMSGVRVHQNSAEPAKVGAHAFAQGTDIHLGPGQDRHLPHEAWHVVQQAQGRVQPTRETQGVAINDDVGLESEADTMGAKALQQKPADVDLKA